MQRAALPCRSVRMTEKSYTLRVVPSGVPSRIDWSGLLNREQLAIVQADPGTSLVLAGAGSGKTRTVTWRVAWLVEQGVSLDSILLLTFTNRAAREMIHRVQDALQVDTRRLWGGTFHSIGRRILRDHAELLGYPPTFGIVDREDAETLVRACIADLPSRPRDRRFPRPSTVLELISASLNTEATIESLLLQRYPQFGEHTSAVEEVALAYASRKREYGVMDFDDLLVQWRRLLVDHPDVTERYHRRFRHVLVDEFQDTNRLQAEIVDRLVGPGSSLMVVGDDFQSIYSFRGAHFRNIIDFPERHPETRIFLLEQNYRSSPSIVSLANASIAHNTLQFEKTLQATEPPGPLPAVVRCQDEAQQAMFITSRVLELRDEGVALDRIAVLYRAHWQSMETQIEFNRAGIPFVVRSGLRFFEQKHIKDLLSFLRFVANPRDELSFHRLVGLAEGIGPATAKKLFLWIQAQDSLSAAVSDPDFVRLGGRRAEASLRAVAASLGRVDALRDRSAADTLVAVRDGFYDAYAQRTFDNAPNRLRELDTLINYADQHASIEDFLDSLALDPSGQDTLATDNDTERVVLTTVHQAKGLEFEAVFVIGLADERFPSARVGWDEEAMEEERRLFYVAVTRARRQLYLTWPMMHHDRMEGLIMQRPSPFLTELERESPAVYEVWKLVADN